MACCLHSHGKPISICRLQATYAKELVCSAAPRQQRKPSKDDLGRKQFFTELTPGRQANRHSCNMGGEDSFHTSHQSHPRKYFHSWAVDTQVKFVMLLLTPVTMVSEPFKMWSHKGTVHGQNYSEWTGGMCWSRNRRGELYQQFIVWGGGMFVQVIVSNTKNVKEKKHWWSACFKCSYNVPSESCGPERMPLS